MAAITRSRDTQSVGSQTRDEQDMERLARWLDERTGIVSLARAWLRRPVQDRWSSRFGLLAVASLLVCTISGMFLLVYYDPSTDPVIYDGGYWPLRGIEMSRAFESTVDLSFEVQGGLFMRQLHHWSASAMVAALMLQILRMFFTGGFRRPRRRSWLLWFGVLVLTMTAGLTGHILPDDMLSGSSLAVTDGLLKGIPVIGAWLSHAVFQGRFPSGAIETFYPLHVLVLPVVIVLLLLGIGWLNLRHGPAQHPGPGKTEKNVVGRPLRFGLVKTGGLFMIVLGVLSLMAATMTVNPIWSYGPADPATASAGGGALWYLAFVDGAQRLVPPGWEFVWLGGTWTPAVLAPLALSGTLVLAAMVYPFAEAWVMGDAREHHLLVRPRHAPTRAAIGVAGVVLYGVLWAAAGSDTIALRFSLSIESVVAALQIGLFLWPVLAFTVTKRICLGLQRKDREIALHGHATGTIVRTTQGGFREVHQPVTVQELWSLAGYEVPEPYVAKRDWQGRIRRRDRVRASLSRWFLRDRVLPATPAEIASARALDEPEAPSGRDVGSGVSSHV